MMTQKHLVYFVFYCIFESFGTRGVIPQKRVKSMLRISFALKFGTYWAFFIISWQVMQWCWFCKLLRCCNIQLFKLSCQQIAKKSLARAGNVSENENHFTRIYLHYPWILTNKFAIMQRSKCPSYLKIRYYWAWQGRQIKRESI